MSVVLSPASYPMSTTTSARTTPTMNHVHVSPRIRPPPALYHDSGRKRSVSSGSSGSRRPGSSERSGGSPVPSPKEDGAVDPFLAQYMKPVKSNGHELFFTALTKQVHLLGYDFYQLYLNHNKARGAVPTLHNIKLNRSLPRKQGSPLQQEAAEDAEQEFPAQAEASRRRRYTGADSPSACPQKKQHSQVVVKTLPTEFLRCLMDDLINLISRMLQLLINLNDRNVPLSVSSPSADKGGASAEEKKKLLTRYHSRTPPAISIHTYLSRLTKFNNFTQATMLTTIYYIDLLSHNFQPYFTLNSWTVHRFLLVATMLAQKSLEDFFYTNDHYAKVGGVALTELNCLELDFLNRVDWRMVPAKQVLSSQTSIKYSKQVLDLYYSQLVSLMGNSALQENNIVYALEEAPASRL